MAKTTKYFELFSALKAGGDKGVTPEDLAAALGFKIGALAVYIHALRHQFGAEIESVRNGRAVSRYRLVNIAEMEKVISPTRKPRTTKAKVEKKAAPKKAKAKRTATVTRTVKTPKTKRVRDDGPVEVLDEDLDIAEITDRELLDIADSLGL
jgi:biotin operon repressor